MAVVQLFRWHPTAEAADLTGRQARAAQQCREARTYATRESLPLRSLPIALARPESEPWRANGVRTSSV